MHRFDKIHHVQAFRPTSLSLLLFLSFGVTRAAEIDPPDLQSQYAPVVQRILEAAGKNQGAMNKLSYLCDRIGARLAGSPQLESALKWASETMERDGAQNVRLLPVEVPRWVRGRESGRILNPVERPLHLLGLGGSIGTPGAGITAPVVVVTSFDELAALGRSAVEGKIVVFNPPWEGYGRTVAYRGSGASRAASLGAVAALVRSVTPVSLQSPHTGMMSYDPKLPKIPAAAVSVEDAALLDRLYQSGDPVEVELHMEAETLSPGMSANAVGEITGREHPEEVVVIGGHIDSWDVGQGAHDDGAGIVVCMETLRLLNDLGLRPRRTVRAVLFVNEEYGLSGGKAYRQWAGETVSQHVAAIEMDAGAEKPTGFGLSIVGSNASDEKAARALATVTQIGRLLEPIGASEVSKGGGGADISPLMREGVPGLGLRTVGTHYFDWHHSDADTVDKINPDDLRANLAAMAVMAYVLADLPERITD